MKTIEVQVKKWHKKTAAEGNKGKWVTRGQLEEIHHYTPIPSCISEVWMVVPFWCKHMQLPLGPYTSWGVLRDMVKRSFAWALARGKIRTNEVHGSEEAKLVLDDWFENASERGSETTNTGVANVEAGNNDRSAFSTLMFQTISLTYILLP